jgi:RNA recognition motif-containing protein
MLLSGIDKITGQLMTLSLRKAPPSVLILNQDEIPNEYFRIIPETKEVNKSSILEHFKSSGEIIKGIDIVTDKKTLMIK